MPRRIKATKTSADVSEFELRKHVLRTATPAQIDTYIETNVTDLQSAKQLMKLLTKLIVQLHKQ